MKLKTELIPKLIQEKFDLVKALYSYNPTGRYTYGQPTFCPFHDNQNTPAAALYRAKGDGDYDSLYCFAEQKQYTVVDVLGKLMGYNIYEVGHAIWNEMSDTEKQMFLTQYDRSISIQQAFGSTEIKEQPTILTALQDFRQGKTTLNNVLQQIIGGKTN